MFWKDKNDRLVLLLALAGASVDAVAIMGFNVLTAGQTGNTILLAAALARGDFALGLSAAISVLAFVLGVAAGELLAGARKDVAGERAGFLRALGAELLLLAVLIGLWRQAGGNPGPGISLALVFFAAAAMGVQSAAVLRLHRRPTTYITGILTTFMAGLMEALIARRRTPAAAAEAAPPWEQGITWAVYLAGATLGGVLFLRVGSLALLMPLALVATTIGVLLLRPSSAAPAP